MGKIIFNIQCQRIIYRNDMIKNISCTQEAHKIKSILVYSSNKGKNIDFVAQHMLLFPPLVYTLPYPADVESIFSLRLDVSQIITLQHNKAWSRVSIFWTPVKKVNNNSKFLWQIYFSPLYMLRIAPNEVYMKLAFARLSFCVLWGHS